MKAMKTLLAVALATVSMANFAADKPVVAITQIVAHPALDADYKGIVEQLATDGFKDGDNITIVHEIAQGDQSLAMQIAQKFVGEKPAVMVGISTPSAQTLAAAAHGKYPIVFTAVTDPISAELVSNKEVPGKNITGTSDAVPLEKSIDMVKNILPNIKTIGTVYNPGEANSESAIKELELVLKNKDIALVKAPATRTSEVLDAARSLIGKADAIYVTTDNTAVSAIASIIQVGEQNKLPVFTVDTASVENGAIAALGFSYEDLGRITGKQVSAILKGEKAGNLPVQTIDKLDLYLNPEAAKRMGVELPQSVIDGAAKIIKPQK